MKIKKKVSYVILRSNSYLPFNEIQSSTSKLRLITILFGLSTSTTTSIISAKLRLLFSFSSFLFSMIGEWSKIPLNNWLGKFPFGSNSSKQSLSLDFLPPKTTTSSEAFDSIIDL